jgi:anhydro-N-acetylmuramic acid kinase
MLYKAIGLMSGSSLDGLDIAYVEFEENGGSWSYEIKIARCIPYPGDWQEKLRAAVDLSARDYQLLHTAYGHYTGQLVNQFIREHGLQYQVSLICSHGHTSFHMPGRKMTAQLGDGAAIAAVTQLPVVSDLRALDVAFGGQGAPIVPIGEKLLWKEYNCFLNLGGIANISIHDEHGRRIAFDVCPANRVLNLLAAEKGKPFDPDGELASAGNIHEGLLNELNQLDYYKQSPPKSLANDFGTDVIFPLLKKAGLSVEDGLRTYTEHIAFQVERSVTKQAVRNKILVTGGGALNKFLVSRIQSLISEKQFEIIIPDKLLIEFKEAVVMALFGILRWRQENNVLSSVTGASRDSIGGALWTGEEA